MVTASPMPLVAAKYRAHLKSEWRRERQQEQDIATAQGVMDRVMVRYPVYPTPHRATRIAAFVIAARLEATREAAR